MTNKNSVESNSIIDTTAGSMAYNRFEMQVSQALHMAIEIFDELDYLLVMDYYDDITLFDKESNPNTVSYYQMKTNEESISINTAISEDWLVKLYSQLENPNWLVNELGLITNCPLTISVKRESKNGKQSRKKELFKSEKTSFNAFNQTTIDKIKEDIAKKKNIQKEDVNLSKFYHLRTTLSIPKHKEIVEQELGELLNNKHPQITLDTVKAIFSSMMEILSKRQSYELLKDGSDFEEVKGKKGVSKNDFNRVIETAMIISIPPFEEVEKVVDFKEDKYKASFEYTKILSDSQMKSESFVNMFSNLRKTIERNSMRSTEAIINYIERICNLLYKNNPNLKILYNETYVSVLSVCILINEMRRTS